MSEQINTQPAQSEINRSNPSLQQSQPQPKSKRMFWFVYVLVFLFILAGFAWWFFLQSNTQNTLQTEKSVGLYKGKIIIGYVPWPGYLGLYIARDKGYFKNAGLDVEIHSYDALDDLSKDYADGKIQARADLNFDAVKEAHNGLAHKVVVVIDHSNGADGIIAKSEIKSFEQVKGKRFAFEKGTLEEFVTSYVLEQHQLTLADIIPVDLNPEESAKALAKGDVDVATTYEPFITKTVEQIHGNKIFSSADAPGLISDILAFRSDFVDTYPDTVQEIVKAYFQGVSFWKEHPQEATALIAKELKVTSAEITTQLAGITVLDDQANNSAFTFTAGLESVYGNLRETDKFVARQLQKDVFDTDSLVEPKFVKNLSN